MVVVLQRVKEAKVTVDGTILGKIKKGVLIFLGVSKDDGETDAIYLIDKVINLRIFEDQAGKMNLSLLETRGEMLVVSQFTLLGDCRKGRRPSFSKAAKPEEAQKLYEYFILEGKKRGVAVQSGKFQAMMEVSILNDGPVTLLIHSKKST